MKCRRIVLSLFILCCIFPLVGCAARGQAATEAALPTEATVNAEVATTVLTQTQPETEPTTEPTEAEASSETAEEETTEAETTEEEATESEAAQDYVVNTNSGKFHYPDCGSAKRIKDSNRSDRHCTRDELIEQGYVPCGTCKP